MKVKYGIILLNSRRKDADDSRNGYIYSDKLRNQRKLLKASNILIELELLLNDDNEGVRIEAASALLQIDSKKTVAMLKEMTTRKGMIPFIAKQTLKHWNKL